MIEYKTTVWNINKWDHMVTIIPVIIILGVVVIVCTYFYSIWPSHPTCQQRIEHGTYQGDEIIYYSKECR